MEIIYRAWDKKNNVMIYDGHCDDITTGFDAGEYTILVFDFSGNIGGFINDDGGKNGLWEHSVDIINRFEIMPGIELSGKKFFVGDIVKFTYNEEIRIEVVIFSGGSFNLGWCMSLFDTCTDQYRTELEVIGNIHENPELKGE